MHLRLSDQELATLVEMVSLAANVASWNQKETASDQVSAFEDLESKILEKAGHSGLADWVEFDEESQRFRVREEMEERLFYHECYEEFRNESFWDELAVRLSDRDLTRQIGFAEWENSRKSNAAPKQWLGRNAIGKSFPSTAWNESSSSLLPEKAEPMSNHAGRKVRSFGLQPLADLLRKIG
ncbi:MAG: hypothetical protein HC845_12075 [Akkermansiaceae bacterium]|nr:hypothetical protein [Akkermansiaceae bacterium]